MYFNLFYLFSIKIKHTFSLLYVRNQTKLLIFKSSKYLCFLYFKVKIVSQIRYLLKSISLYMEIDQLVHNTFATTLFTLLQIKYLFLYFNFQEKLNVCLFIVYNVPYLTKTNLSKTFMNIVFFTSFKVKKECILEQFRIHLLQAIKSLNIFV